MFSASSSLKESTFLKTRPFVFSVSNVFFDGLPLFARTNNSHKSAGRKIPQADATLYILSSVTFLVFFHVISILFPATIVYSLCPICPLNVVLSSLVASHNGEICVSSYASSTILHSSNKSWERSVFCKDSFISSVTNVYNGYSSILKMGG